jgi:hypothetical protein
MNDVPQASSSLPAEDAVGNRDQVLRVRIHRDRRRELALMSRVFVHEGERFVEKRALYPEGARHVEAISQGAEWMRKTWRTVAFPRRREDLEEDRKSVVFEFVPGTQLVMLFSSAVARRDRDGLAALFATWRSLLEVEEDGGGPLADSPFGPWPVFENRARLRSGNLDPGPGNLVRDPGGTFWAVDPEWCLCGSVPAPFVLGRCWLHLKVALGEPLLNLLGEDEILALLRLSRADLETALRLETTFQSWVSGSGRPGCLPSSARRRQVVFREMAATIASEKSETVPAWAVEREDLQRRLSASEELLRTERVLAEGVSRALAEEKAGRAEMVADLSRIQGSRWWRAANVYWRFRRRLRTIR